MMQSTTLTGTIIIYPRGDQSVLLIEGRTFVVRGPLLRGLRELAGDLRTAERTFLSQKDGGG